MVVIKKAKAGGASGERNRSEEMKAKCKYVEGHQ